MKRFVPLIVLLLGAGYIASTLFAPAPKTDFDLAGFGRLPVLVNGRIKPLDTVARNALLVMRSKQYLPLSSGQRLSPIEWLADVLFVSSRSDAYRHFRIDNSEVLDLVGLKPADGDDGKYFSFTQLEPKLTELDRQAQLAEPVEEQVRTAFQKQVIHLRDIVLLYQRLKHSVTAPDSPDFLAELGQFQATLPAGIEAVRAKQKGEAHNEETFKAMMAMAERYDFMDKMGYLLAVPPAATEPNLTAWTTTGHALLETFATGNINANVMAYATMGRAWHDNQPTAFNTVVAIFHEQLAKRFEAQLHKGDIEVRFNAAEPFYTSMLLYAAAFFLAIFSWLKWPDTLGKSAFYLVALAWALATAGILTRMWLEGRPPVTNLYSSALFVGWGSVGLCLVLEKIYKNAIGSVAGGMIGFATLIIAHMLSLSGDTLEMMRAVLDSNFWLATHVVVVTTGYAATFLAGFLALIYIVRGVFTSSLDKATADTLARMVYGIVCFATLFSLVGTVLGGIWADQSWGRFWGWDPKENGALIIVIWNAVILHARWGGLVKQRGLMALAVFGNIVTSWSWFGVNMLGVGLHSYGFMEAAFYWLIAFVISQLLLIALAQLPLEKWRSFQTKPA